MFPLSTMMSSISSISSTIPTTLDKDDSDLPPTCTSSTTTTAKKTVSFADYNVLHRFESYPRYLKEDLWYSSQEYKQIQRRNARHVEQAHVENVNVLFRPDQYRGLERIMDEQRKSNVFRSIQAVLLEQERRRSLQEQNEQVIADMYRGYCVSSVQKADRLAKMDAQDAVFAIQQTWQSSDASTSDSTRSNQLTDSEESLSESDSIRVFQRHRILRQQQQQQEFLIAAKTQNKDISIPKEPVESMWSSPSSSSSLQQLLWMNLIPIPSWA